MKSGRKIGLLGGTFDPVHNGHLAAAEYVRQALGLDRFLFIPAARPPHKVDHPDGSAISSFADRKTMLTLVLASRPDFTVSTIEAERRPPSYTIDTLRQLHRLMGVERRFFFILGEDAFLELATWKEYESLPDQACLVVVNRGRGGPAGVRRAAAENYPHLYFDEFRQLWLTPAGKEGIRYLEMEPVRISSTGIRRRVRSGRSIAGLVPAEVAEYIRRRGLYRG